MRSNKNGTGVPAKIRNNPEVIAWLKKTPEFKMQDFAREFVALPAHPLNEMRREIAELITSAYEHLSVADRRLADLYLQMPPRKIAKELKIGISATRNRVKRLRLRCQAVLKRERKKAPTRSKPRGAVSAPVRRLRFNRADDLPGKMASLVLVNGQATWVDENGGAFSAEEQELLSSLQELQGDFEVLDVEAC